MLVKSKRIGDIHGVAFTFEQDEVRYLASHLNGAQPKLTFHGTIGQGLKVWFEPRGMALRDTSDQRGLEAVIEARCIAAFQGTRPNLRASVMKTVYNQKPVLELAPIAVYDRDAPTQQIQTFNPALPRPDEIEQAAAAESLFKPKSAPEKPVLSRSEVADIVRKHSNGTPSINHRAANPTPIDFSEIEVPATFSTENDISEVKAGVELINSILPRLGEDLILGLSTDRRRLTLVRRKVVFEEVGA